MDSVNAFIQARMGSSRLPGKVLKLLCDIPVLQHVVSRVSASPSIENTVVLTSTLDKDDPIEDYCRSQNISVFRGSELDVLDRYYQASLQYPSHTVVRVTADCPLLDPEVLTSVVEMLKERSCDYCSNTIRRTYPKGLDVEAFSSDTLETIWKETVHQYDREHVTPYIYNHPNRFSIEGVEDSIDRSEKRLTLDYQEDFKLIEIVFKGLYGDNPLFGRDEIYSFLEDNPSLEDINGHLE